jgi:N6-adenosine-specific RNA methylase IME4
MEKTYENLFGPKVGVQTPTSPIGDGKKTSTALEDLADAGRYRVIAADPAWRFKVRDPKTGLGRSADRHYITMALDDIKALPVAQIAAPNCWLMLWTTWPHMPQALEVIEAWGFKYSSGGFVWIKLQRSFQNGLFGLHPSDVAMGMGYTTRKATEPCLLARRGNPCRLRRDILDVILAPIREHSRKPDAFYERVEQFAPGPRLDLFARQRRPGWDAWGNELDKFSMASPRQAELAMGNDERTDA